MPLDTLSRQVVCLALPDATSYCPFEQYQHLSRRKTYRFHRLLSRLLAIQRGYIRVASENIP